MSMANIRLAAVRPGNLTSRREPDPAARQPDGAVVVVADRTEPSQQRGQGQQPRLAGVRIDHVDAFALPIPIRREQPALPAHLDEPGVVGRRMELADCPGRDVPLEQLARPVVVQSANANKRSPTRPTNSPKPSSSM